MSTRRRRRQNRCWKFARCRRAAADHLRHRPRRHFVRRVRRRDRRHRRRFGQWAGRAGRAAERRAAARRRRRDPDRRHPVRHARCRLAAAALGLAFVPEERLGRGAVPSHSLCRRTRLLTAHRLGSSAAAWSTASAPRRSPRAIIEKFNVKANGAAAEGAEPVRRQSAEIHRRARDRAAAEAAAGVAADLGRRCRRRRLHPPDAGRPQPRRRCGAGRLGRARRAVRDLRPAAGHLQRPGVALADPNEDGPRRGRPADDWPRQRRLRRTAGRQRCASRLSNGPNLRR